MPTLGITLFSGLLYGLLLSVGMKLEKAARMKLFAALIMIIMSIIFWAIYEQNAGSMNLLAERNAISIPEKIAVKIKAKNNNSKMVPILMMVQR